MSGRVTPEMRIAARAAIEKRFPWLEAETLDNLLVYVEEAYPAMRSWDPDEAEYEC